MKPPRSIDLRPAFARWDLTPRQQGARGTCSVFAVTAAIEYAAAARRRQGERLSVEFLNWAAHRATGRSADGGFFSEIWRGFAAFGACPEPDFPYRERHDPAAAPSEKALSRARSFLGLGLRFQWIKEWDVTTGLTEAQAAAARERLARRTPVCAGLRWPKAPRWENDTLQMCPPEEVFDGHSVLWIGYRDDARLPGGGAFLIRNSGGDGRDGWLPYVFAQAYTNDACWIE